MKYMLLTTAALLFCIAFGWLLTGFIFRKKKLKFFTRLVSSIVVSFLLIISISLAYLSRYYHADSKEMELDEHVHTEKIDGGYYVNGPGNDTALIFYPGAKIEAISYLPLMTTLADRGVDCFLADMPFRMAFLKADQGEKFMKNYSYEHWAVAGHSMGGVVVSSFASDHVDEIETVFLLASYPNNDLEDSLSLYSIYGSEDGCLGKDAYEGAKKNWPDDSHEFVLEGGNHAQYGNYGNQAGDGEASMSREEQQERTAEIILEALKKLEQ